MSPTILTETSEYFVIDKPAGLATEPPSAAATLRDWLLEHKHIRAGEWNDEERCGIVHRLDSDTSGIIIWAKTRNAQRRLRQLWQGRVVRKNYLALVAGEIGPQGVIEVALMRDNKKDRQVPALFPNPKARPAITEYERLALGESNGRKVSLVQAHPITGRTHQIRVHLKSIGHPIIGDVIYGEKDSRVIAEQLGLTRQFLHAESIELDGQRYTANLPEQLQTALSKAGIRFEPVSLAR